MRERFPDGVAALDPAILAEAASRLAAVYEGGAPDDEVVACARAVTAELALWRATKFQGILDVVKGTSRLMRQDPARKRRVQ